MSDTASNFPEDRVGNLRTRPLHPAGSASSRGRHPRRPASFTPGATTQRAGARRRQAEQLHLVDERHVIVLAGRAYATAALQVWPAAATPLAGAGGLGRQLAVLAGIARSGVAAAC